MLRVVFELLIVEEKLLAGGKYELGAAIAALQNSVDILHGRLPKRREITEIGYERELLAGPVSLSSCCVMINKGPGRSKFGGEFTTLSRQTGKH
jgi:hypothetical protein